jgi:hypothetical protein
MGPAGGLPEIGFVLHISPFGALADRRNWLCLTRPTKSRDRTNRSSISAQKRRSKAEFGTFVVGVLFVQHPRSPSRPALPGIGFVSHANHNS